MVNDPISQLLFNTLAQRRTVVIPGIGSLRFRRVAAKLDHSTLTPPRNMFRYSSREEGLSLLDMIIERAGCTQQEGEEAYRRWLHRIKQGHSVVIEGVGRIEEDFFKPSEELERLLNPVASTPITLQRRRSLRGVWIALATVALVALGGAAWWYVQNRPLSQPKRAPMAEQTQSAEVAPKQLETVDSTMVAATAEPAPVEEAAAPVEAVSTPAPAPAPAPSAIGEMSSGVSYVVMGVFSTEENARKYIEQLAKRAPEISCRAYRFQGSKFMVSGFESAESSEASAFIRSHRSQYPDLWVYKRK